MEYIYKIKEALCGELEKMAQRPGAGVRDIEQLHKLTDTIKNLDKILALEEEGYSREGYSRDSYSRESMRGGYSRDSYEGGGSNDGGYSGRRMHYVRGHYSRDEGREDLVNRLEQMMHEAGGGEGREAIKRCIEHIRGMA